MDQVDKQRERHSSVFVVLIALCLSYEMGNTQANDSLALEAAKVVADKIIRETVFDFKAVRRKPVLGIEFVDFRRMFGEPATGVAYARSRMVSAADTTIRFGVSSHGPIQIWFDGQRVFQRNSGGPAQVKEIAYNMVEFDDVFEARVNEGENRVLIKSRATPAGWTFYLRPTTATKEHDASVTFSSHMDENGSESTNWLCIGPFASDNDADSSYSFPPEEKSQPFYRYENRNFAWVEPPVPMLAELVIKPSNSYKRESYAEWHYGTGAAAWAMIALSEATGEERYRDFARRYCDSTLENYDYFKWQYENLNAFRGSYHRLMRRTMLDDTGAPALPFLELQRQARQRDYSEFIAGIADFIMNDQLRLEDGTFCRPEPFPNTVWADDLFMSSPFLLRMGQLTGDAKYFDDVARQVLRFFDLLYDPQKGLFKHAWFGSKNETSVAYWGRANGWVAWATSEALLHLPKDHASRARILKRFQDHMNGLSRYQNANGAWHQVLDHADSFEETSCTAMFSLAMARGVLNGWLSEEFSDRAWNGWQAVERKIAPDGTVRDICRGTGIGYDLAFYFNRQRFDHDPRGLGAVITAAVEVSKLKLAEDSQ